MNDNHEGLNSFKRADIGTGLVFRCIEALGNSVPSHVSRFIVNTTPSLKDLYRHVTPKYAPQWRVIGILLDLPNERLNIIEHDHVYRAEPCCNAMLANWLQVDTTASWRKLLTVIESPAVSCCAPDKGN